MRVVQATFGVFHQFALARELERRGHLERIYTTWPWARVKREAVSRSRVETFPWIHLPDYLLGRAGYSPVWLQDAMGYANALAFDRWTARRIPACDAFIALSGAGLLTGKKVQARGGVFLCDRGSSHQRYQDRITTEEHRRWNVAAAASDERDNLREEAIYAAADAVIVPSSFSARSFAEMGVDPARIHQIPYGVELEQYEPAPSAPAYDEGFQVLFVGGVSLRKGIPYLLQAFAALRSPRKRLRIIGSVSPELKPVLARLPQDDVTIAGALPKAEVIAAMQSSHVMVLPSIEDGFGLVLSEAMACGCPVVATENTGGPDLITDGVEGFLIPIRDAGALADRLQRLADSPELQREMRARSLDRVEQMGGWTQYGERWEALLQQLTNSA